MNNKVALVTGASSGIGRRCAQVLAANGATVFAAARRLDRLEGLRDEIVAQGGQCIPLALDVTSADSLSEALALLPDGRLDILVNNAGIGDSGSFEEIDEPRWQSMLDTNLTGAWRVAREAARLMSAGGGGSIVCTASILGLRQAQQQSHYATAKAGLIQLVKSMALELARQNIRVNALAPGYILTEINDFFLNSDAGAAFLKRVPMRRYGTVDELDGVFLLLCSDASSFMTGSVITVDGGHVVNSL